MNITIPPTEIEEAANEYAEKIQSPNYVLTDEELQFKLFCAFFSGATFATTKINQMLSPVIMEAVEALEQIATGYIDGEPKNYKLTLEIARNIASEALNKLKALSNEQQRPEPDSQSNFERLTSHGQVSDFIERVEAIEKCNAFNNTKNIDK